MCNCSNEHGQKWFEIQGVPRYTTVVIWGQNVEHCFSPWNLRVKFTNVDLHTLCFREKFPAAGNLAFIFRGQWHRMEWARLSPSDLEGRFNNSVLQILCSPGKSTIAKLYWVGISTKYIKQIFRKAVFGKKPYYAGEFVLFSSI